MAILMTTNRAKKVLGISVLLMLFMVQQMFAQRVLTGVVMDDMGEIPGVNVYVENNQGRTLKGVITDVFGKYILEIPDGEKKLTVVFSFIGMQTKRIPYTGQKVLDIQLSSEATQIQEVEISAKKIERNEFGISDREMVSSTQKIDMKDLVETVPVSTVEEALQGQLAGVDITMGGDPGARSAIRIRGMNTLSSSAEPLFVIDGVPVQTDMSDDFDLQNANEEDLGALLGISPSDIESVEVLKDASATAIWGAKGANGVLSINTKKGTVGKTRFSFSSKYTLKFEPNTIPMLDGDQYTALMQDAIWNAADYVGYSNAYDYLRLLFDTPEIGYDPKWQYFDEFNVSTDWLDAVRQNTSTWENTFSMSGGGEKATYRLSLGYISEGGTTVGTSLDRFNTSLRVDYNFSKKLKFGANFSFSDVSKDANWNKNVRSEAFKKMPNKSPYVIGSDGNPTGDYFVYQTSDWEGTFNGKNNFNPVAMANEAINHTDSRTTKIILDTKYKILPELTYSAYASLSMSSTKVQKFLPQSVTGVAWNSEYANLGYDSNSKSLSVQTENRLNFIKNWRENTHQLIASAVFRTSQSNGSSYVSSTSGMASSDLSDPIVSPAVQEMSSSESEGRSYSGVALLNYSLMRRFVIQASMAIEGNAAFGRSMRTGYFPGAGVSWNIQNEPWLEKAHENWLDELKLRFSYGESGNAPKGNSVYLGAFAAGDPYMNMSSITPTRMQLDKLKWETSKEYNAGFNFSAFDSRWSVVVDYYDKRTSDLLQKDVTIPSTTGYSTIKYFNSGEIQNQGVEVRTDITFFKNKDWNVTGSFNVARNRSKILEMPVNMSEEKGATDGDANMKNGTYAARVIVGQPIGGFYGYRYKGVYSTQEDTYARTPEGTIMRDIEGNPIIMRNGTEICYPGDAIYEDINYDGVINQYDIVYLGNSQPILTGGANFTVRYKAWSVRASFHGRFGQSIVNATRMNNECMYGKSNQSTAVLRRWRNEGDVTDIPRALYNEGLNYLGSDRFVEEANYIRLKTLTLNYNLPKRLCKNIGVQSLGFFVTGYNLFTWTDYSGQDPEVKTPSSAFDYAEDSAQTPSAIRISTGINLNF